MAAVLLGLAVGTAGAEPVVARPAAHLSAGQDAFLDRLERADFRYFEEQADPHTGLVRDRARADGSPSEGKASIAACGFALSAWAIAVHRGWVDRATAVDRVGTLLRFLAERAPREHGFFYHFMDMGTGARAWGSEVSSIDTALFLAGAITARAALHDPEITALVDRIAGDVDWPWFMNGGRTLAMAWRPGTGFSRYRWSSYSEQVLMSLLAVGAVKHPADPSLWRDWAREPAGSYAGYHYLQGAPLFIHQYPEAYFDFRGLRDAYADYYRNSVLATRAQRQYCIDLHRRFPTWGPWLWGVTASDSVKGYRAWGGPPPTGGGDALDGTITPSAAAGSIPFAPAATLETLRHMRLAYGGRIWKRYGFVDAFNPETGWVDADVIGIDAGISMVQAENARTGLVWAWFMRSREARQALARAGFVPRARTLTASARTQLHDLAAAAWRGLRKAPVGPETEGLRLTAVAAAQALGLLDGDAALAEARTLLDGAKPPTGAAALGQYAAGLVTLRQAFPALAEESTRRLDGITWAAPAAVAPLGAAGRLTTFLEVAAKARPPTAWTRLARTPERVGPVWVLAPAAVGGQLLPGLWLDERSIITGASAGQLAYAVTVNGPAVLPAGASPVLVAALLLDQLPQAALARLPAADRAGPWLAAAPVADRTALLISLANLLVPDCVRRWFQEDPLVRAGRARIPGFAAAAFGRRNSLYWWRQLAGPSDAPPLRRAVARAAATPRQDWDWQEMAGPAFKDYGGDVRPGDPPLAMKFAFTWDPQALHFHAVVVDDAPGTTVVPGRNESVELFVDPRNQGLAWYGPHDYQFAYSPARPGVEWFHHGAAPAAVHRTANGYTVEATIPWTELGLAPQAGLELGVSPAVAAGGPRDSDPALKLNWRFHRREDGRYGLGLLRLQ